MSLGYLIVGQGLAGTILADMLRQEGQKVQIVDDGQLHASSVQAAGLVNPITGRRFVKSWLIDQLIDEALVYYRQAERISGFSLLRHLPLLRILRTAVQENDWLARSALDSWEKYMGPIHRLRLEYLKEREVSVAMTFGVFTLNISLFLRWMQSEFRRAGCYVQEVFDYKALEKKSGFWSYKGCRYEAVIFSEGYKGAANPFFSFCKYRPTKGELLTISSEYLPRHQIIKDDIIIIPLGGDRFWVGATYTRSFQFDLPSRTNYVKLRGQLDDLLAVEYTLLAHHSGVRPTVKDRRPVLGEHPELEGLYCFNGFGAKGTSLIPFFARHFVGVLLQGEQLMSEVDLRRFWS